MTVNALHGGPRPRCPFGPASRTPLARCQTTTPKMLRSLRPAASGGFQPDHVGASSSTDATATPASLATPGNSAPLPSSLVLQFASFFGHLRVHASLLAQHLGSGENAPQTTGLSAGLGTQVHLPGSIDAESNAGEAGSAASHPVLLPLHSLYIRLPGHKSAQHSPPQQTASQDLQQQQRNTHALGTRLWMSPILSHFPWRYEVAPAQGSDHAAGPYTAAGLALLWHSALSLQQRSVVTALWHMGQAVEAAHKARRNMPPPAEVPGLVHFRAVAAAAQAEEAVTLVLARTATAASAAAAGVPAAAATVTGSAAVAAAAATVAAPHLPVLRAARRRLLAAATPILEQLRGLQRGCTTHVLLRFLLFSAVNPGLRRNLRMRLDVLARRAAQVALLHEQHDTWVARQLPTSPTTAGPSSSLAACDGSASAATRGPLPHALSSHINASSAAAGVGSGATSLPEPLSARWYRRVFAPEMLACARQLQLSAPGSPPDDRTAGDPPGRFDLRDLYRLIRVLEVAVEDLERYEL